MLAPAPQRPSRTRTTLQVTALSPDIYSVLQVQGLLEGSASEGGESDDESEQMARVVARIEKLLEARESMYKQADLTVPLGSRDDAGAPVDVVIDRILEALDARVSEDAVQSKLKNEPKDGDITVTDPRGELGPKPNA